MKEKNGKVVIREGSKRERERKRKEKDNEGNKREKKGRESKRGNILVAVEVVGLMCGWVAGSEWKKRSLVQDFNWEGKRREKKVEPGGYVREREGEKRKGRKKGEKWKN